MGVRQLDRRELVPKSILLLILLLSIVTSVQSTVRQHGRIHRSPAVRREFMREHPCPANGRTSGPCAGWVVDHVWALCVGGPDSVANMHWQTVAESRAKDRWECKLR
jgi:hypothetical protein